LATRGALECARNLAVASIAFPGMGTGVGGLSVEEAATVMVDEIKKHLESGTTLKTVLLVGFDADLPTLLRRLCRKVSLDSWRTLC